MTTENIPAPRAKRGGRANLKVERNHDRASAGEGTADGSGARPRETGKPQDAVRACGRISFAEINKAALAALPAVLARILSPGKRVGAEIVALNPRRADRSLGSFKVNLYNGKWADFATGDRGGDPVSLVAYVVDISQIEAAHLLARILGLETRERRNG